MPRVKPPVLSRSEHALPILLPAFPRSYLHHSTMLPSKLGICAIAMFAVPRLASGTPGASGLPAKLASQAKVAFADIAKAKSALNVGNTKTSQSYLAKSEGLLKSVLNNAPTSAANRGQNDSSSQQGTSAVSQAESEVAKLDPSLAGKMGAGNENPADGNAAIQGQGPPSNAAGQKSTIAEIKSAYEKVTLAQTLLRAGNSSKAKSVLDQIPSSPLGLLKNASGL